ncbi:MAG: RagB/SusD family nutrient uptake outer membrane protein [Mangrovibacterium sp.]
MKVKLYLVHIILIIALSACDDLLEREVELSLTEEQVTTSYENTEKRLSAVYTYLPNGFSYIDGAMMASASDEAEHTLETSAVQKFNTGAWSELDNPDGAWKNNFSGIRTANLFLATSDSVKMDYLRLDPNPAQQASYATRLANIRNWKYEARFLRAFFYFELVKRYGGVPILKEPVNLDEDYTLFKRMSLPECIRFITDECDSAASVLPVTYDATSLGRATKGAALALKSRVLLYAASDLFNSTSWAGGYGNPDLISLTGDRSEKWKAAADGAKKVIDLPGTGYQLATNYITLFRAYDNKEIIFTRRYGASNSFEKATYPVGYDLGNSGTTPSQNLVDDYEMSDGSSFDWNNPDHAAAPFSNRDPRLNFSILTNNTLFKGRKVECWVGGLDGPGKSHASRTGHYLYKYVDPELDLLQARTSVHHWTLFRLAEIYLNYAEALNEYDPGHPDIKIYVDRVRQRNGVNMPALPDGLSQSEMRDRIRHERRIELAFEDHRLWDVRRWMLGTSVLNGPLKGLRISKVSDDVFSYQVITVESRKFEPKMYLYPIPQNELNITGWAQNPLW